MTVKNAKQLQRVFPKFNKRQFANSFTDDETFTRHYFEPVRGTGNKMWPTKKASSCQRTRSTTKFLCNIFFWCDDVGVQITVPKGTSFTSWYYWDVILKNTQENLS